VFSAAEPRENNKMAEKKEKKLKSKIGGQALIEGIMMKGPYMGAMACRLPDGTIDLETWEEKNGANAPWYKKVPLVRGVTNFISNLIGGYKYTMWSAEKQTEFEERAEREAEAAKKAAAGGADSGKAEDGNTENSKTESGKTEEEEKSSTKLIMGIAMGISVVLGLALAIGLFVFLPKFIISRIPAFGINRVVRSLTEGVVKIILFIFYMWAVGLTKETGKTYKYHGAEHKTIACHEARLPLTVENVRKQCRLHPRCGTSFIFIVLIISILVMCLVPFRAVLPRVICSLCLLPAVVSISYEFIRFAGRSESWIAKVLSFPGLQLQRITTKEPDDDQIEVAIAALKPCIPENEEDDVWG
jgi:uncharacterized protein YqhQ